MKDRVNVNGAIKLSPLIIRFLSGHNNSFKSITKFWPFVIRCCCWADPHPSTTGLFRSPPSLCVVIYVKRGWHFNKLQVSTGSNLFIRQQHSHWPQRPLIPLSSVSHVLGESCMPACLVGLFSPDRIWSWAISSRTESSPNTGTVNGSVSGEFYCPIDVEHPAERSN